MRKRVLVLLRYRVLGGMNLVTGQPAMDRSRKGKPDESSLPTMSSAMFFLFVGSWEALFTELG